jgi:hypothetical protein
MLKIPFCPPGSKRGSSHETLSLENWMRNFLGTCSCCIDSVYMHLTKQEKEPWAKINYNKEVVDTALSYMRTILYTSFDFLKYFG